ncbi:MAG: CaiB/BaiF CoA-transferase family protein [Nitrospinota bacterium]
MPLSGVRVLDLTRLLPGGQCTLMLAHLGADVIKVEDPTRGDYGRMATPLDGRGASAFHLYCNIHKRSLALDLKHPEGVEALLRLVKRADVLVESFRPGVLDRLGVGYGRLSRESPRLIYCAITGYGQDGPLARAPGHDLNFEAMGGTVGLTGPAGGPPFIPGVPFADIGAGMWAAFAIVAALRQAERTGRGQFIDMAMLDTAVGFLAHHAQYFLSCGTPGGRETTRHNGRRPSYRLYPTADGRWLAVACSEPKFWKNLCRLIGRLEFEGESSARGERRREVIAALEETFRERTQAEWLALFEGEEVCVSPVLDVEEVFSQPQVRARGLTRENPHPAGGSHPALRLPPRFADLAPRRPLAAPGLGEHSREVLEEAGFSAGEIGRLFASGASHAGREPEGETLAD